MSQRYVFISAVLTRPSGNSSPVSRRNVSRRRCGRGVAYSAQFPDGTISLDIPGDIVVESSWRQLELVFSQLVENGLEHSGEQPTVEISVAEKNTYEGMTSVLIQDDGPGIPQYELEVFEKGEETALEHGSGLGLWLVDAAITTLGGDLSIVTDDDGTVVRVDIPGVKHGSPGE